LLKQAEELLGWFRSTYSLHHHTLENLTVLKSGRGVCGIRQIDIA